MEIESSVVRIMCSIFVSVFINPNLVGAILDSENLIEIYLLTLRRCAEGRFRFAGNGLMVLLNAKNHCPS